jgi:MFS family permease
MPDANITQPPPGHSGWRELLASGRAVKLAILLGAELLYAMNALLASTIAPSAIREFGGIAYITWPTAAFLASSIASASAAGVLKLRLGARRAFIVGALVFGFGTLTCAFAGSMAQFIGGRFVQGGGGGVLATLSYVLIRSAFPQSMWPRVFALISGVWSVAVLLGPLVGGVFANAGSWRGAFLLVAGAAALLAVGAAWALARDNPSGIAERESFPIGRLGLLALSIAAMCSSQVSQLPWLVFVLIVLALGVAALALRLDRVALESLFPGDAFSLSSVVGLGLWMALLLSIANGPFPLYGPLFLQELHGMSPLSAGYMVALEAIAWTCAAVLVSGYSDRRANWLMIGGPLMMGAGLSGIALAMPSGTVPELLAPIFCSGAGIGSCWAFMAQRVMKAAKPAQSDLAASAVATVQLFGLGFGGSVAGLIGNLAGYSGGLSSQATRAAAFWVPASFVVVTAAAAFAGARMVLAARRTPGE